MRLNQKEVDYLRQDLENLNEFIAGSVINLKNTVEKLNPKVVHPRTVQAIVTTALNLQRNVRARAVLTGALSVLDVLDEVRGLDSPLEQLGRLAEDG